MNNGSNSTISAHTRFAAVDDSALSAAINRGHAVGDSALSARLLGQEGAFVVVVGPGTMFAASEILVLIR